MANHSTHKKEQKPKGRRATILTLGRPAERSEAWSNLGSNCSDSPASRGCSGSQKTLFKTKREIHDESHKTKKSMRYILKLDNL